MATIKFWGDSEISLSIKAFLARWFVRFRKPPLVLIVRDDGKEIIMPMEKAIAAGDHSVIYFFAGEYCTSSMWTRAGMTFIGSEDGTTIIRHEVSVGFKS